MSAGSLVIAASEQEERLGRVVIGMDPHKHSATIEVMDDKETVLGGGRFGTDTAGYRAMLGYARRWRTSPNTPGLPGTGPLRGPPT